MDLKGKVDDHERRMDEMMNKVEYLVEQKVDEKWLLVGGGVVIVWMAERSVKRVGLDHMRGWLPGQDV